MQIDNLRGDMLDQLFEAILSLESKEECYRFFDDLATMNEVQSFAQRFQVAEMLSDGQTYQAIEDQTQASTATISRIRRSLKFGSGGYGLALERLKDQDQD